MVVIHYKLFEQNSNVSMIFVVNVTLICGV